MSAAPKSVAELLAERVKFTQWLGQLAARTAGSPPHVVAKVRADYEARLVAVKDALAARASELDAQRDAAKTARDEAAAAEQTHIDARAEAELRHSVGEYTKDEWVRLADASNARLSEAAAARQAAQATLDDLERALADVGAEPPAAEPVAPPPPPAEPVPEPEPPLRPSRELRPSIAAPLSLETLLLPIEDLEPVPTPGSVPIVTPPADPRPAPAEIEAPRPAGAAALAIDPPQRDDRADVPQPAASAHVEPPVISAPHSVKGRNPAEIRGTEAFDDLEFLKSLGRVSGMTPAPSPLAGGSAAPPIVPAASTTAPAPQGVPGPTAAAGPASDAPPPPRTTTATSQPMTPVRGVTPAHSVTPPRPPVIPAPSAPPRISQQFAPPPEPIPPDPSVASPEAKLFQPGMTDPGVDSIRASSFSASSLRASGASSAAKSLKCAECGAMNSPTEWYCERCGGELASL